MKIVYTWEDLKKYFIEENEKKALEIAEKYENINPELKDIVSNDLSDLWFRIDWIKEKNLGNDDEDLTWFNTIYDKLRVYDEKIEQV